MESQPTCNPVPTNIGNFQNHTKNELEEKPNKIQLFSSDASPQKKYTNNISLEVTISGAIDNDRIKPYNNNHNNRMIPREMPRHKANMNENIFNPQLRQHTNHSNDVFIPKIEQLNRTFNTTILRNNDMFGGIEQPNSTDSVVSTKKLKRSAVDVLSLFGGLGDTQSQDIEEEEEEEEERENTKNEMSPFSIHNNSPEICQTSKNNPSHRQKNSRNVFQQSSTQHQTNTFNNINIQRHNQIHQSNSTDQTSNNNNNSNTEHDLPVEKIDFLHSRQSWFNIKGNHGGNQRLNSRDIKTVLDLENECLGGTNSTKTPFDKHDIFNETSFDDDELLLMDNGKENVANSNNIDKLRLIAEKENLEIEEEDFFSKEKEDDNGIFYNEIDVSILIYFSYFFSNIYVYFSVSES